jgi:hypothetical protein
MPLPFVLVLLSLFVVGPYPPPPRTGPASLWVSLLALALAYIACLLVAAGLGMAPAFWRSREK